MRILMIGTGNVATVFCRLMKSRGVEIALVAGRNEQRTKELSEICGTGFSPFEQIPFHHFDLAILALSDDFLLNELYRIPELPCPVVHTAGSVPMQSIKSLHKEFGVFYPLQSLRKEMKSVPPIPLLIDANTEELYNKLYQLASLISTSVNRADDETRKKLHLAAVWVNNFTNHLYSIAHNYCTSENLPFEILQPLINETACRIALYNPNLVQTGPAIRGDHRTMEKHLDLLKSHPEWKALYIKLSESIIQLHRQQNSSTFL